MKSIHSAATRIAFTIRIPNSDWDPTYAAYLYQASVIFVQTNTATCWSLETENLPALSSSVDATSGQVTPLSINQCFDAQMTPDR